MASFSTRPNGRQHVFFAFGGKRHTVRLGLVERCDAAEFARRLERIIATKAAALMLEPEQRQWLNSLAEGPYNTLAKAGVVSPREATTLAGLAELYLARLAASGSKPQTIANAKVVCDSLTSSFGPTKRIVDFSANDADKWRDTLLSKGATDYGPLAPGTVSRRCRYARSMFKIAHEEDWITRNPFSRMKIGSETNTLRDAYVSAETIEKLIDASPDPEFRLFLAVARYAGLRCPSEILPLEWGWFDWDSGTFRVFAPKTAHHADKDWRIVPIHESLAPYVTEAWDAAHVGQTLVFPNHQVTGAAITGRIHRLCRQIGVPTWPKTFVNLRASCERDLFKAGHPIDEIACWMGHSPEMALRHYSRVVKEQLAQKAGKTVSALRADRSGSKAKSKAKVTGGVSGTAGDSKKSKNV